MSESALATHTRQIVVVLPSWVGDVIMSTPVLRALREHVPQAHITGIMRPGQSDVLAGNPWLDAMITCDMKGSGGIVRLARAIKSTQPESCLLLPNSFRAGLAARLSGTSIRIGYKRESRGWLLTHPIDVEKSSSPVPTIDYYAHLACVAFGIGRIDRNMELFVTADEEKAADHILKDVSGPFALLNPGGNKLPKRWPPDRFAKVADALFEKHDLRIVLSGAPSEANVLRAVMESANPDSAIINAVERGVTLGALKPIILRARLMITNDTGPRHMAAALGTPLVSLFGSTDHRWTTLNCPTERILLAEPFLPEHLIADNHPQSCHIERIQVEDVIAAAENLL